MLRHLTPWSIFEERKLLQVVHIQFGELSEESLLDVVVAAVRIQRDAFNQPLTSIQDFGQQSKHLLGFQKELEDAWSIWSSSEIEQHK